MGSEIPLVSIITPSWNSEKYIEQTIASVLAQTYPNIEYIIVDGKSSDGTVEIIKRYESRISCWVSEPDEGMYQAINKGMRLAKGEIVAYLNSDDLYFPETVETVVGLFLMHPDADLIYGDMDLVDEGRGRTYTQRYPGFDWRRFTCSRYTLIGQPASFWRKSLFDRVGGFDETMRMAADFDFFVRAGKLGNLHHVNKALAKLRLHAGSLTSNYSSLSDREAAVVRERHLGRGENRLCAAFSDILFKLLNWRVMLFKLQHKFKGGGACQAGR